MRRNRLGRSGIVVSNICMGTMTFGSQADEKTAFRIMDIAYDAGIDFYDCEDCEDSSVGKFSYLRCYPPSLTQVA